MWGLKKNSPAADVREENPVSRYMEEVCDQIRFRRARPHIVKELADHIEDRKLSLVKVGISEEEALRKAVLDMGDAVGVGQELDRLHRPKPEWGIILITAVMLFLSAFVQYYLSAKASDGGWAGELAFYKYMTALPVGIAIMLVAYFADYTILGRYPKRIYAGILLLCIAFNLYDGQIIGFYSHNAQARYQMVYLAFLLMPAYGAVVYSYRNSGYHGILKCGVGAVLAIAILSYSHRVYIPAVFAIGGLVLLSAAIGKGWFAVEKKKAFALVYLPTLISLLGLFITKLWRYGAHKDIFLNGLRDKFAVIHPNQPIILFARSIVRSAKFIGEGGLGQIVKPGTVPVEEVLPVWWGDLSLTYLIHQWGFVTGIIILTIVTLLMLKMIQVTFRQKNALGFIISLSAVTAIGMQCILFLSANLGLFYFVILPLPLMTMGQASFLVNMTLLGLLLSAYRNADIVRDDSPQYREMAK